jgi:hypothetical protein
MNKKQYKQSTTTHSARFTYNETKALYRLLALMQKTYNCRAMRISDVLRACLFNECERNNIIIDEREL